MYLHCFIHLSSSSVEHSNSFVFAACDDILIVGRQTENGAAVVPLPVNLTLPGVNHVHMTIIARCKNLIGLKMDSKNS